MDKIRNIVFLPSTEIHVDNFMPVIQEIKKQTNYNVEMLSIPILISRAIDFEKIKNQVKVIHIPGIWKEIKQQLKLNCFKSSDGLLVIGSDSSIIKKSVIRFAKKKKYKVVLLQDGWLEKENINRPIKYHDNYLKYFIRHAIAHNFSPIKNFRTGFIGQNSDYHFVYSEFSKNEFIQSGIKNSNIVVTGSPRHQLLKIENKNTSDSNRLIINNLVYFSTIETNEQDRNEIVNTFASLKKSLENIYKQNYQLIIKCHPSESSEKYNSYLNENIRIFKGTTEELLSHNKFDIAFSYNSTVILEISMKKTPVIQLVPKTRNINDSAYFKELASGTTENELTSILQKKEFLNKKISPYYLADFDQNHDSVNSIIKNLFNLFKDK